MERMVGCFEETGYACYLWIIGKTAGKFGESAGGGAANDVVVGVLNGAFAGVTEALGRLLSTKDVVAIPDGKPGSLSYTHKTTMLMAAK
jgi:hypothetical protein